MFFSTTVVPVIFNSRDVQFKNPVGAVHPGEDITVTLLVSDELEPVSVRAIVINDEDKSRRSFEMTKSETIIPTDDYLTFTASVTPKKRGLYWYFFVVKTKTNEIVIGKTKETNRAEFTNEPESWQQTVYERDYDVPEWIKGGVFYHIFVDRFNRSGERVHMDGKITRTDWGGQPIWKPDEHGEIKNNDFFGGNLKGIEEKLDYLKDLGITCIYLSPIFKAYSNHKYDTSDFMSVDPMFGTEEDFKSLCKKAKSMGIHIIMDGVFSHTGSDSIYFDKNNRYGGGAYHNMNSKYRDWYYFTPSQKHGYETWWGIETLPRVNKDNPDYIEFINGENGVVRNWLRLGADGWRLDVVDELPNSFLQKLVKAAKEEKKDSIIIGEVWEDASNKVAYETSKNYFDGDKLDSVMNYPFKNSIIDFIRHGNAAKMKNEIEEIIENYPKEVLDCLMNILGTHDTQRILSALADRRLPDNAPRNEQAHFRLNETEKIQALKRLKIASVIQMTLPGVPCIYYGDEAGVEGGKDPFNRTCYPWGKENQDLLQWYKNIIKLRKENRAYTDGSYRTVSSTNGLFAFERRKGNNALITAANCGFTEEVLVMAGTWKDLLTGRTYYNNITVFPGEVLLLKILKPISEENDSQNIKSNKGGLLNGIQRTIRKMD